MGHYGHVRNSNDDPALNTSPVAVSARRVRSGAFVERRAAGPSSRLRSRRSRPSTHPGRSPSCPERTRRSSPKNRAACGWSTSGPAPSRPSRARPGSCCRARAGCSTSSLSPRFAADKLVYLTYAEPSANGGSGLALARGAPRARWHGRADRGPQAICGTTPPAARAGSSARSSPSLRTGSRCS